MNRANNSAQTILVVEDIEETRDGIEELLQADGYRVKPARSERDAIESALRQRPDLILVSLAGVSGDVVGTARRIRERAQLGETVPIVLFCIGEVAEGDEVAIGDNVHITRPENFNQLRGLFTRLLREIPTPLELEHSDGAVAAELLQATVAS
jgi:CheY-like chemotaxis protein